MANWKTTANRKRRNIWKRRGHMHIKFNHGLWTYAGLDPEYTGLTFHVPFEREQPNAYLYYPQGTAK